MGEAWVVVMGREKCTPQEEGNGEAVMVRQHPVLWLRCSTNVLVKSKILCLRTNYGYCET